MIIHNMLQIMKFAVRRMSGRRAALRRRSDGALVLRTAHGPHRFQGPMASRIGPGPRKRLAFVVAMAVLLSMTLVSAIAVLDQVAVTPPPLPGAGQQAGMNPLWNLDVSSDLLFVAGVPVFATLAGLQVYLLALIRKQLAGT